MKAATTRTWMMAAAVSAVLGTVPMAMAAPNEALVPPPKMDQMLPVRNIRLENGVVTGEVVNSTAQPMRDVRLDIDYEWLWPHEFRPGTDRFSRLMHYTVPGDIPPGGSRRFSFGPDSPLPKRHDGRYMAIVHVARALELQG